MNYDSGGRNSPRTDFYNRVCGVVSDGCLSSGNVNVDWDYGGRSSPSTDYDYTAYYIFPDGYVFNRNYYVGWDSCGDYKITFITLTYI